MQIHKARNGAQTLPSLKLSNGYILPEGKLTPNTLFVGGIDMKVDENEIKEFFARYGTVKEVKIITYRGGICKGYGFVSFSEDVDIQTIVEQQINFKGRKLKLGPAIMKERSSRSMQSHLVGPSPWMTPSSYVYCSCGMPVGSNPPQPPTVLNGGGPYVQPYSYSSLPGVMIPPMPLSYSQTAYAYQYASPHWSGEQMTRLVNQNCVDCGVQTLLTLL
ncbi:deleted in azoospermia-like isoform X3 [Brienomyrus brachyistius]|uniref:deleted in azoospermia-like isoform X2 n=1 Tax=Brienomyrus brachyistius TaxID=42636 RepID=UPI0020B41650|nr:deleted in azoospermia-like isoform X2 [Brienomyrus brachyistius]XP_048850502.1 deleted in azoospermia-like isoform X3 [Brienomyrus brachyistius]